MSRPLLDPARSRALLELLSVALSGPDPQETLRIGAEEWKERKLSAAARSVAAEIDAGGELSGALALHLPGRFVAAVESGELEGDPSRGVERALRMARSEGRSGEKLVAPLLSPVLLVAASLALLAAALFVLLPVVEEFRREIESFSPRPPVPAWSELLEAHSAPLLALVVVVGLVPLLLALLFPRLESWPRLAPLLLRVPLLGRAARLEGEGLFAGTLAELLAAGLTELQALPAAAAMVRNAAIRRGLAGRLRSAVEAGEPLRSALLAAGIGESLACTFDRDRLSTEGGFDAIRSAARESEEMAVAGRERAGRLLALWGYLVAGVAAFVILFIAISPVLSVGEW